MAQLQEKDDSQPIPVKVFLFNDLIVITNAYVKEKQIRVLRVFESILATIHSNGTVLLLVTKNFILELILKDKEESREFLCLFNRNAKASTTLCSMCHKHIQPGCCCVCSYCHLLICDDCGGTYEELTHRLDPEEYLDNENRQQEEQVNSCGSNDSGIVLCKSCYVYRHSVAPSTNSIQKVIERKTKFIRPSFPRILSDPYDPLSRLPAGWGSALTEDGKSYFFNPLRWLSSWSLPKDHWENDCPAGYAKYYNRNGNPFYYDARAEKVVSKLSHRESTKTCSCCGYLLDRWDSIACPCCNSIIHSFSCMCLLQQEESF